MTKGDQGCASRPTIIVAFADDEFGPPELCQDDSEALKCEARLITGQSVQPTLDVDTFHHGNRPIVLRRQSELVPMSQEFGEGAMRKASEASPLVLIIGVPEFEDGILRRAAMLVRPKVIPQMVHCSWYVRMAKDWAIRNILNCRARALLVGIQDPDDVIAVFCLIALIDRVRLQHEKGQQISDSDSDAVLDSAMI